MIKYVLSSLIFFTSLFSYAAKVSSKDAYKAMLNLYAYNIDGKLLHTGTAFYIDNNGTAITSYNTIKKAYLIEVSDYKGRRYKLHRILGANSTTDLVKFNLSNVSKNDFFNISTTPTSKGSNLLIVHYTTDKKRTPLEVSINSQEPFNNYNYYHISAANDSVNFNCPLIDAEGNIAAIVQQNVDKNANKACAIDARFINDLSINATTAINSDLTALHLPKALPQDAKDALTYLYIMPTNDSIACTTAYADYISACPNKPEGYMQRGTFYAAKNNLELANTNFAIAIEKSNANDTTSITTDAIHNSISRIIYNKIMEQGKDSTLSNGWTLSRAEEEAEKAYAIHPYTLYLVQRGNCLYAQKKYKQAFDCFKKACDDKQFVSSETFFSAARSLELSQGDAKEVITLLDSCIARIPSQNKARYAQFYFERSQRLVKAKEYRKAVADYNEYEQLVGPRNLSDQFYYMRSRAEENAHMYQQALDDLHTAIATANNPILYQIDEAALLLNIGEYQSAIQAAQNILKQLPENPDCYKILGIAHGELKHKAQALQYLKKTQELGDDSVKKLLERYNK